jgi:hypothetical protein
MPPRRGFDHRHRLAAVDGNRIHGREAVVTNAPPLARPAVLRLAALGQLPHELDITDADLRERETLIDSLEPPASDEEERLLLPLLGEGTCWGLAWGVVHLVESSPSWPDWEGVRVLPAEWREMLWANAIAAGFTPPAA